jgi:hypothetical protein
MYWCFQVTWKIQSSNHCCNPVVSLGVHRLTCYQSSYRSYLRKPAPPSPHGVQHGSTALPVVVASKRDPGFPASVLFIGNDVTDAARHSGIWNESWRTIEEEHILTSEARFHVPESQVSCPVCGHCVDMARCIGNKPCNNGYVV